MGGLTAAGGSLQINAISTLNFGAGGLINNGAMNLTGSTVSDSVTANAGASIVTTGGVTVEGDILRAGAGAGARMRPSPRQHCKNKGA